MFSINLGYPKKGHYFQRLNHQPHPAVPSRRTYRFPAGRDVAGGTGGAKGIRKYRSNKLFGNALAVKLDVNVFLVLAPPNNVNDRKSKLLSVAFSV